MMPASILAEALRNQENIHIARERVAVRDHVARNYRTLALPAVAAAKSARTGRDEHRESLEGAQLPPGKADR
jgi:hypothetical protein